jgi:hypothetical protein
VRIPNTMLATKVTFTPRTKGGRGTITGDPVVALARVQPRTANVPTGDAWAQIRECVLWLPPQVQVQAGWDATVGDNVVWRVQEVVTLVGPSGEEVAKQVICR